METDELIDYLLRKRIEFKVREYKNCETLEEACEQMGIEMDIYMKSILAKKEDNIYVILIPHNKELENDTYKPLSLEEIKEITKVKPELITPLQIDLPIIMDKEAAKLKVICLESGEALVEVLIDTKDFISHYAVKTDNLYS